MLTGAFDSSSAIFLLYRMLYERLGGISLKQWFLGYLIVPVFIMLVQLFIMPSSSYKTASELAQQAHVTQEIVDSESEYLVDHESASTQSRLERREDLLSEIDSLLGGHEEDMKRIKGVDQKRQAAGVWGVMHGKSVSTQLSSFWFWGIAGFTIIQMVCPTPRHLCSTWLTSADANQLLRRYHPPSIRVPPALLPRLGADQHVLRHRPPPRRPLRDPLRRHRP